MNIAQNIKRSFRLTAAVLIAVMSIESNAAAVSATGVDMSAVDMTDAEDTFIEEDTVSPGQAGDGDGAALLEFKIDPSLVSPTQASGAINIENGHERDIYIVAAAISEETLNSSLIWLDGLKVRAKVGSSNGRRLVYTGYDGAERENLKAGKTYRVYASPDEKLGLGKDAESGYIDEDTVYLGSVTVEGTAGEAAPLDGSLIKFKAVTQKSQSVKLTWKTDKNDEIQSQFKTYNIKRLVAGEYGDDSWEPLRTGLKKKTFTDKRELDEGVAKPKSGVYLLECCDADGKLLASYIAVAAPWLFYAETDYDQENAEFCVTRLSGSDNMGYRLQTAKTKAAFKGEESPSDVTSSESAAADLEDIIYKVSTSLKATAVRPIYAVSNSNIPDYNRLKLGEKAFFRARAVYYYKGVKYTSSPSNVIGKKVGPVKCSILSVEGVRPDISYNTETVSPNQSVHHDSTGTCYKEGYIAFYGIKDHKNVQYYELLRSTSHYGSYKAVKKYKLSEVTKFNISGSESSSWPLYYVKYNNFPPEKTYYYAIRAVAQKAAGGFSDGVENRTEFERVYGFTAADTGLSSAKLKWNHDDCAKQYWIYRAKGAVVLEEGKDSLTQAQLDSFSRVKKVNASKVNKEKITDEYGKKDVRVNSYTDGADIAPGTVYTYIIRPVYNTGAKKALKTDMTYLSVPMSCTPTVTAESSGGVTAAAASVRQITLKWSKIDLVDGYEIQRTSDKTKAQSVGSTEAEKKAWEDTAWEESHIFKSSDKEFKELTFTDAVPQTGTFYYYRVRGISGDYHTKWDALSSKGMAVSASAKPMAVEDLKAERLDGSSGSDSDLYRYGARVSWTLNSKDAAYLNTLGDNMRYIIEYSDDNGANWANLVKDKKVKAGTMSYEDTWTTLNRGKVRKYRVRVVYKDGDTQHSGTYKTIDYSKPKGISVLDGDSKEVESLTLTPDSSEMTLKVYSYSSRSVADDGKVSVTPASVKELDGMYSDSGREAMSSDNNIVKVTGITIKDGYAAVTIKATGSGTAKIKLRTYDYSWTSGGDSAGLVRTITVTVK